MTQDTSDPVFGVASVMAPIREQVHRIARSQRAVLITGENGTGKSRLAKYIHKHSGRSDYALESISCAALPKDLLESELYGYEKGAFSGAHTTKPGRVEMAQNGSLFLDEIGEMPIGLQPKLLTFLQDKTFYSIGGRSLKTVDVRVIAATNVNLENAIAEGSFRQDLLYRLNVFNIHMPALRERKEDIPILALRFLGEALEELRLEIEPAFSPEALDSILHYKWPGNIRELENAMHRVATLMNPDGEIRIEHLSLNPQSLDRSESGNERNIMQNLHGLTLAQIENEVIKLSLQNNGGNKQQTARELGISEKSVYNKIKKYGITL